MTDALKCKAERAAREYAIENQAYHDTDGVPVDEVYIAGYLAHAKEAEALVEALQWVERWAQAYVSERNVAVLERVQAALARYRGGAK